jgi:hypothetical protein
MELDYLYSKIARAKNDLLMEEPCPMYEPQWEEPDDTQNGSTRTRTLNNTERVSGDD